MRIAVVSPYSAGPSRGNVTTVRRVAAALGAAGADVAVYPLDVMGGAAVAEGIRRFCPDVIHAFHATLCGETACRAAADLGIPAVITMTGSDLFDPQMRAAPATARAMAAAAAIACFNSAAAADVARHFPAAAEKTRVIPQGIERLPLGGGLPVDLADDAFVVLLPAALRPVKNVGFPVAALSSVVPSMENKVELVVAGGVIDAAYGKEVRRLMDHVAFARALGEVPYEQMGDLYCRADLVLNCSLFEGMSNSLLEAMALERPVLASDIPGNRAIIRHGDTGWLYADEEQFVRLFREVAGDAPLRAAVGRRAGAATREDFSPAAECAAYLALYRSLVT